MSNKEDEGLDLVIEWCDKNKIFIAKCPQFPDLVGEGDTEEEAMEDLSDLIDEEFETDDDEEETFKRSDIMIKKTDKVIGIYGWSTGDNSWGAGKNHLHFCDRFANVRILAPWETAETSGVDLLYLPGGADALPSGYGEAPGFHTGNPDVYKQHVLDNRLKGFIDAGIPVYGVCLGMQQLQIFFGGALRQHAMFHEQSGSRWGKGHKVFTTLKGDGSIDEKAPHFEVNSHHHQILPLNLLSEDLQPLLYAVNNDSHLTGDSHIVEAFRHREFPVVGLAYHPEEWYCGFSIELMNRLLADK